MFSLSYRTLNWIIDKYWTWYINVIQTNTIFSHSIAHWARRVKYCKAAIVTSSYIPWRMTHDAWRMTHDAWRMTHDACMTAISESNLGPVHIYGTGYEHITHLCVININLVSYSKKCISHRWDRARKYWSESCGVYFSESERSTGASLANLRFYRKFPSHMTKIPPNQRGISPNWAESFPIQYNFIWPK